MASDRPLSALCSLAEGYARHAEAQEKSPETVSVLRLKIESESEGVSISSTQPASFLRSPSSQRAENH